MLSWRKCSEKTASPEQTTGRTKSIPKEILPKETQMASNVQGAAQTLNQKRHVFTPELRVTDRRQPKRLKLPPIPEVVWQQPSEASTNQCNLNNTNNDFITYYTQETSKTTVASETWPPKGTKPQNYVVAMEQPPGNQTRNELVPLLICSGNRPTDIRNSKQHVTTTLTGDTTIPPLSTTTPLIGERLVRDE